MTQEALEAADLARALEAVLLFHAGGPWDEARVQRWRTLTGSEEATTKTMCDAVRKALANYEVLRDVRRRSVRGGDGGRGRLL